MVDILSTIVSIIQLVDTALKAREYLKDFRNAPGEQLKLFAEMDDLKLLLAELQKRVSASPSTSTLQQIAGPLSRFNTMIERFATKWPAEDRERSKLTKQLTWTLWNKKESKECLDEVESIKSLINVWLTMDIGDASHQQSEILAVVAANVRAQQERSDAAQHKTVSEWMTTLNFFQRQADLFNTRQPGTGEWLLSDPKFKAWESSSGSVLWCRGMPGGGKTVLSSIVVNHLQLDFRNSSIGVACVYLNHKETETQTPSNIISGLCKQLLVGKPIPSAVAEIYNYHTARNTRPSVDEILDALRSVIAEYSKIYFVVDALDEQPEDERNILLEYLSAFMLGRPCINLMITSRPNISLAPFLPDVQLLEIQAADEDIRQYVNAHIRKSSRLSKHVESRPELRDEIQSKIIDNVKGMFLLAKLNVASLTTKNTVTAVREALQQLPKDLKRAYDGTMERIEQQNDDDKQVARLALIWVANAKRPLTVKELREALAIKPDATTRDVDNLLDIDIVLSVCAGLLIVDNRKSAVRLVHYTTQGYLDSTPAPHFQDAHTIIASRCFTYLSFVDFSNRLRYPLMEYCQYCLQHARDGSGLEDQIKSFLNQVLRCQKFWAILEEGVFPWNYTGWPTSPSLLWILASSNLVRSAEHLLMNEKFEQEELHSPFCVAFYGGHLQMIKLLSKFGANLDAPIGYYCIHRRSPIEYFGAALQIASVQGNGALVRLLIEMDASVDALQGHFGTALQAVSYNGNESIVRLLIEMGAEVNIEGGHCGTALQAAAQMGHEQVVQLLVDKGANLDAQVGELGTALQAASYEGHQTLVRFLIESGADVNTLGGRFGTPLQAATLKGYEPLVRLLIEKGANVNLEGGYFGTALQAASVKGHEGLVRLLIGMGANVDGLGGYFGTALQAVSYSGKESIVQLLIEMGADVNVEGGHHGTALQAAARMGHEQVVRLLVDKNANLDAQTGELGTALLAASYEGHQTLVRFLIESGADVNTPGGRFGTPLQAATIKGHEPVVQLLIENGANVNSEGGHFGTALQAASVKRHEQLVRLLKKGADVNGSGGRGWRPRQTADTSLLSAISFKLRWV